ncbi:MAG: hypothetical protein ACXWWC_07290 [Chitinophagaceae bacterium]
MVKLFVDCLPMIIGMLIISFTLAQDLKYYLPDSITYNPSIPKPKDIIYPDVGEYYVTHDLWLIIII